MNGAQSQSYEFGRFRIDGSKRLLVKDVDQPVTLTPKVFDLLLYLVGNSGKVISKDELMSAIWADTVVEESNLSQNISILRRTLGEKRGEHQFIATIPGHGYKFVADARAVGSDFSSTLENTETPTRGQSTVNDELTSAPSRNSKLPIVPVVIVILAVGLLGVYFWRASTGNAGKTESKTIAVLPFKAIVPEHRDEVLEMGMADTLIARLGDTGQVIVRPLGSVRRFGDLDRDPQSAGRELDVDSVLDGSIQRWGDKIRVNVRLVNVADGASLWSGTFDEKFTDIFLMQDTIAQKVSAALALRLNNERRGDGTQNLEAYRFYLQGRYHTFKLTPPDIRRGIEFYQQAIDLDPFYARAHAGMAHAYGSLPITSDVKPKDAFPKAKAAAQRALEIDENSAEALIVLGTVAFWFEWDWENAERQFKKAIDIKPDNSESHRMYSVFLTVVGRHDEAVRQMSIARELDPLSLAVNALEGQTLFYAGDDAEAVTRLNKTFEIESNFWIARIIMARILIEQKRFDEAIVEAERAEEFSAGNSEASSLKGYALAKAGRREESLAVLAELERRAAQQYVPTYNIALIRNGLGNTTETLDGLEKAFDERDARVMLVKVEPKWNNLRSEPRFVNLVRKMGLD